MIPKIIHNIWIQGYNELPEEIKKNHLLVKKSNPEWEFMIWDKISILKLLKKYPQLLSMYKNLHNFIVFTDYNSAKKQKIEFIKTQSSIAKYVILKEYGGVYYDVNLKCLFQFNELFDKEEKENMIYLVKNSSLYSDYFYYIYPFFLEQEINSHFMAFSKDHPVWETVFSKLKTLRTEKQIDSILDSFFICNHTYPIIYLQQIGDCFEKKSVFFSLSNPIVDSFLQSFHCYYRQIYLLIILFLLVYVIHHITVFNNYIFSFPSAVQIPSRNTSTGISESKTKTKSKSKSKK